MIPLKDNIPTRHFPIVSVALIVANLLVFLADRYTGEYVQVVQRIPGMGYVEARQFVGGLSARYAMIPAEVTAAPTVAGLTVFTSMFLHANWLHVGGNMLSLWIFGNNVEDTLGRLRFIVFYLATGVAAAAAHILSDPSSTIPTVGASGAVAGLMGAYLILFPHARILAIVPLFVFSSLTEVPAVLVIGLWALLQFLNASLLGGSGMLRGGGVAYFAHLGGFVAGVLIILLLGGRGLVDRRRRWQEEHEFYWR